MGAAQGDGEGLLIASDDDEVGCDWSTRKSQDEDVLGGGVDAELVEIDTAVAVAVEDALAARTGARVMWWGLPGRTHRAHRGRKRFSFRRRSAHRTRFRRDRMRMLR